MLVAVVGEREGVQRERKREREGGGGGGLVIRSAVLSIPKRLFFPEVEMKLNSN